MFTSAADHKMNEELSLFSSKSKKKKASKASKGDMSFVKKVTTPTGISINPQGTELTICSFDKASPTIVRARISPEGFLGFSTPAPPPGGVVRPLAVFFA
jgi:hypothetical protein